MIGNDTYVMKDFIIVFIDVQVLVFIKSLYKIGFSAVFIVCNEVLGFHGLTYVAASLCLILSFIVFITFICFLTLANSFVSTLLILVYITKSIYRLS